MSFTPQARVARWADNWWTDERTEELRRMRTDGLTFADCAQLLGTTRSSIAGRLLRIDRKALRKTHEMV